MSSCLPGPTSTFVVPSQACGRMLKKLPWKIFWSPVQHPCFHRPMKLYQQIPRFRTINTSHKFRRKTLKNTPQITGSQGKITWLVGIEIKFFTLPVPPLPSSMSTKCLASVFSHPGSQYGISWSQVQSPDDVEVGKTSAGEKVFFRALPQSPNIPPPQFRQLALFFLAIKSVVLRV